MLYFVFITLVASAVANVVHNDRCPELKPMAKFNLTAYAGTWHEISKYPNDAEKDGKCVTNEYKLEGDVIKVKNSHVLNGVQSHTDGTVKLASDANGTGKLVVTTTVGDKSKEAVVTILTTDYTNYAIVYTCKSDDKNKSHEDFVWILSRSKTLVPTAQAAVDLFLKANERELDTSKFLKGDFSEEACKFNSTTLITETKH